MAITRQDLEQEAQKLAHDKTWKGHVTLGIIILIIGAVVSSPLFMIVRDLLEIVLLIGGLALISWGIYQYVQTKEIK